MKPFSAFILFSVFLSYIAGCMHERRAYFVSVEGGIKPITTRNRYTLVDAKHKGVTANVDLMAGNMYKMRFTNEDLRKFQPNVFSNDGIRIMLDYKILNNRTLGSALGAIPCVLSLGVLPLFNHWEKKSRYSLNILDNPDASVSFEYYQAMDSALTLLSPLSFLFYNGDADVSNSDANYTTYQTHKRQSFLEGRDTVLYFSGSEETLSYAIAALLKKMEDDDLIVETNNKHADRNETLQNSVSDKYEIVEFRKDEDCAYRYSFILKRRDSNSITIRESRELKKILRAMIREDYLLSFPDTSQSVVIDFSKFSLQNGGVVGKAVALTFSVASLQYDPHRRMGVLRVRIGENQFEEARQYARKNIASIARDKNIALEANKIPATARYYLEGEKLNGGMLEISFTIQ